MPLNRLDVSSQRFEGLDAAGTEALATGLRYNKTLQELGISGNGLGTQGEVLAICVLLGACHVQVTPVLVHHGIATCMHYKVTR